MGEKTQECDTGIVDYLLVETLPLRSWMYANNQFTNSSDQRPYHNGDSWLICRTHKALQFEVGVSLLDELIYYFTHASGIQ